MTLEALNIFIYVLLIFGAFVVQGIYSSLTAGAAYGFSNREVAQPGMGPAGLRIDRTIGNLNDGAIMYLPLALLAVSLDISNGWTYSAALLTIISRLLYVPVFVLGIRTIRTVVWTPSFAAVPLMSVGIMLGAAP